MRASYSYESILRAVGQVLDNSDVTAVALHETDTGVVVEGINTQNHTRVRLSYDLGDLITMIDATEGHVESLFDSPLSTKEARTLRDFLARHETVLAR